MEKLPVEKHQMVTNNLRLVHFILQSKIHTSPTHPEYEDMFQEGCIGLILAAIRFDESKGFEFSTFASKYIIGFVRRYKRERSHIIRIGRDDYEKYVKMIHLIEQGYPIDSIPQELGISPSRFRHLLNSYSVDSIDREVPGKDGTTVSVGELVADWKNECNDMLFEMSLEESLGRILSNMKEPHKSICEEWFYCRMYGEHITHDYLADKYSLSQPQVSRILNKFKKKLLIYLGLEL